MSDREITKVISIRIPAKFFQRLGYLAYHSGRLPSETARQILIDYLNLGCVICGGPVHEWEGVDALAICVDPSCAELVQFENLNPIEDFSEFPKWGELPGFSDK